MPEYNEIVNIIVRWREEGKKVAESIKQSLGKSKSDLEAWKTAGQRVARVQTQTFEDAGRGIRKVTKDFAVPLNKSGKQIGDAMVQIGEKSQSITPQMKRVEVDVQTTRDAIERTSTTFTKVGSKWVQTGRTVQKATRGFRMEYLNLLFVGMALKNTFGGMISGVLETAGVFEYFGAVLFDLLWPVLEPIMDILFEFGDWLMGLPDWAKFAIGAIILIAAVLGVLMMVMGMLSIVSIPTMVGSFVSGLSAIGAAMMANPIILIIMAIIAAIILLYLAWKNNWFGIRDILTAVGKAIWNFIKAVWDGIVAYFKWWFDFFSAIWSGNWKKAGEMVIGVFKGIWNFLQGVGKWFLDIGKSIIKWLAEGIISTGSWLANAILGLIPQPFRGWITGAAKAVGGFLSGVGKAIGGIFGLQAGGIAKTPMVATIAEKGPEVVAPLADLERIIKTSVAPPVMPTIEETKELNVSTSVNIGTVNLNTTLTRDNVDLVLKELMDKISFELSRASMGKVVVR